MKAPLPADEAQRLEALRGYNVLDTPAEQSFDDLTFLAAHICQVPIALVSLVDDQRQWFKSKIGVSAAETARDIAFCAHTILHKDEVLEVRDAEADPRFADSPLVTSDPHVRFYAGAPLVSSDGHALGALCVMDREPRTITPEQVAALRALSRNVVAQLELRRKSNELTNAAAERLRAESLSREQFVQLAASKDEADRLLALSQKSRRALLSVVEDEKRSTTSLRESEEKFRQLADNITDVFWITSPDLQVMHYVSSAYEMIWGFSTASLYANPHQWIESILPQDRARVLESFGGLMDKEPMVSVEYRIACPDGTIRWIHDRGFQVRDAADNLVRLTGIACDITKRKRAESRFRRLVDSNVQGVMFANAKGEITDANDAFLNLLGYSRQELAAGRINWGRVTPPEYAQADRHAVEEMAVRGVCTPYEKQYFRKDGSRVSVLIGAAAFENSLSGEGVCFVIDLTERKKLEQQFLRAQRMESIGTLAGGIAHDLNNVLAPILMSVALLKDYATDEQSRTLLASVESCGLRGANLVKQVLSFARGGVEGERVTVNLLRLMRDLLKVMQDTFPKSIITTFTPGPGLWTVQGDATQIHQVFLNLCVNARDAMPAGGNLNIRMENTVLDETYAAMNPDTHSGAFVLVTVEDTGMGIPPEIQDRIFEPFFTTKGIGIGTGLGLSTSVGIVKSHGGFINLYSEVGKGTKFKVYFRADTTSTAEEAAVEQAQLPRGNGELVLVVDDEAVIRGIVHDTLERFGYRVLLAKNGAEAVAAYAQHRSEISVVLTDMAMPIMDGPALIIALKTMNPLAKIIGTSGMPSNEGVAKAVGAGVQYFVPKPYTAETILTTLQKILGKPGK